MMRAYKGKIRTGNDLYKLVYFIRHNFSSDSLRLRASFIWITENISYDIKAFLREDSKAGQLDYAIEKKKAICGGYAALLKYFCDAFGIENEIILGFGRTGKRNVYISQTNLRTNHAWNVTKINGTWRLLDATWAAGSVDDSDENNLVYKKQYQDIYYFTPPEKMILNHFPTKMQFQYTDKARNQNTFIRSPLFLSDALGPYFSTVYPDTALIKAKIGDTIFFRIETDKNFKSFYAYSQHSDKTYYEASPENINGWIEFKYPVKFLGSYNLYIGSYSSNRTRLSLLGYKLEIK